MKCNGKMKLHEHQVLAHLFNGCMTLEVIFAFFAKSHHLHDGDFIGCFEGLGIRLLSI